MGISQDIRAGFRLLAKNRAFAATAILTLALGIGANSAIFSVVNAVLLRPLPFREPDRLLGVWGVRVNYDRYPMRIPDFLDYRDRTRAFDQLAAYGNSSANLTGEAEPQRLACRRVTGNFFSMFGVQAILGRVVTPEDDTPAAGKVAMLSYGLWESHYGSGRNVIGRKITLNGDPYTVIGVLPREFLVPGQAADLYIPLVAEADPWRHNRASVSFLRAFGRLKPGVTPQQAGDDMNSIARQLAREHPEEYDATISLIPLRDEMVGNVRVMLLVILAAVGMVLLIACANLASFLLAKTASRRKELAIRAALGGTRFRIIRQLLTESAILALGGGLLGALFAAWSISGLLAMIPANLPRAAEIHVDARMFWATFSISVFAALLVGLLPALEASAVDLNRGLQGQGRGTAGSLARSHLRRLLVSGEVALSLVLLIAAGLLLKSFHRLRDLQPGFDSRNALAVRLALPSARYSTPAAITALHDRLRERLASLPQVESAGAASILPLSGLISSADFQIAGRATVHGKDTPTASYRMVDSNYFPAMRMPILRGRNFTEQDRARSRPVAIISDIVARMHWPDRDPVGAHLLLEDDTAGPRDVEVVGVVTNVRLLDLESDPPPVVYVPLHQIPADNARWIAINWFWVIRTHGGFSGLDKLIRRELHAVDGDIAASSIQPVDEYLSGAFATRRFSLSLIAAFAGAALLLAACGLYALISHFVIQRTREIGVRVALGAQARDIFWQVVGEGLLLTSAGVTAGLAGAFLAARLISTMLFGVTGYDAITMAEVATLLLATGVAASYFPARRAIRIDPLVALREE